MMSESTDYMMLVHHFTPENRSLRRWLTQDVINVVRDEHSLHDAQVPSGSLLCWAEFAASTLHWQNEPWIGLRDVLEILAHPRLGQSARPKLKRRWAVLKLLGR